MKILRIILGILMVMCAASILTTPIFSSIALCWIISIIMLVSGIIAIFNYIEAKNAEKVAEKNGQPYLKTGIGSLIFAIAAIIISILSRRSVDGAVIFMQLISTLFGIWLVLNGISMIVCSVALKKLAAGGWLAMMVLGIFLVIMGVACIVDIFTGLVGVNAMFGVSMMMAGFSFMFGE